MKIIKKEHDFYDIALEFGSDMSIIYNRKITDVELFDANLTKSLFSKEKYERAELDKLPLSSSMKDLISKIIGKEKTPDFYLEAKGFRLRVCGRYVVFCGEVIPFLCIGNCGVFGNMTEVTAFSFSIEQFTSDLSKITSESEVISFLKKKSNFSKTTRKHRLTEFFKNGDGLSSEDVHHDMDCPILLLRRNGYTKNPILRDIHFNRKYDAYSTYQKLEQYISGVLGGQSPKLVEVADKFRIEAHGFDNKMSFRKRK